MTDEALTAPPEPLVPMAVTHAPTARLLDVVDFVSRTLVVDARATVTSDAELLVEPAVRLVPSTVSESPETDTTLPVTNDPLPALANPPPGGPSDGPLAGALPVEAPSAAPLGGVPPPAGGPPVPGPAVAGPAVVVQAPDEDGEETVTDWAVILPLGWCPDGHAVAGCDRRSGEGDGLAEGRRSGPADLGVGGGEPFTSID